MLVGALGGVVGVHVLLRRLPFFVVAMSHATFPGVVLASVLGISLFVGGTAFGLVVVALVVALGSVAGARRVERHRRRARRLVRRRCARAVGAARGVTDLSAFLVGSILTVTPGDMVATVAGGGLVSWCSPPCTRSSCTAFDPAGAPPSATRCGGSTRSCWSPSPSRW